MHASHSRFASLTSFAITIGYSARTWIVSARIQAVVGLSCDQAEGPIGKKLMTDQPEKKDAPADSKASTALPNLAASKLTSFYRQMLLLRRFEERAGQLYGMGYIGGFCHLYNGQEAIAVGMHAALGPEDRVVTAYRDHGHILAAGTDPKSVMAELLGTTHGISKGKGGSMHLYDVTRNFFGGHAIVGAQVPLGTGLAFASAYQGDKGVAVTYFGDGAANQGQVSEAFNMAALWKLPCLYVIENNLYAMGTSVERSTAQTDLFRRGESMGIEGVSIDGMDILEVHDAAEAALQSIREGNGPRIIEARTYRYRGHSMSDPAKYRSREEVDEVREQRDPIDHLKAIILEHGLETDETLKEIDVEVRAIVTEAAEFAQNDALPKDSELYTDIYAADDVS